MRVSLSSRGGSARWGWPVTIAGLLIFILILFLPPLILRIDLVGAHVSAVDKARLTNNIRGVIVQALTGLAILAGAWTTWRQFAHTREASLRQLELGRESNVSQSLVEAVNQLANSDPAIRVGGIMTLGRLVAEMPTQLPVIDELLATHVRFHAPWPTADGTPTKTEEPPRMATRAPDIQAALSVLGRNGYLRSVRAVGYLSIDLSATDLRRADLNASNLVRVRLKDACLRHAGLIGADLRGADLLGADLQGAHLFNARADPTTWWPDGFDPLAAGVRVSDHLRGADLRGAWLDQLDLKTIDLTGALADEYTQWPDDFDLDAAGVIIRESTHETPPSER